MKVILVGSGMNMQQVNDWDTTGIRIVGVNNVWKGTDKWDHLIHAGDYPFKNQIKKTRENQSIHTRIGDKNYEDSYIEQAALYGRLEAEVKQKEQEKREKIRKQLLAKRGGPSEYQKRKESLFPTEGPEPVQSSRKTDWEHARKFLGLPIVFTVSHWALHYLKPTHMAYIGFDMNYTPSPKGHTAFYGLGYDMQKNGIPDPMFQIINAYGGDETIVDKLFDRLRQSAPKTQLYNLSTDSDSRLPWDKISFDDFSKL